MRNLKENIVGIVALGITSASIGLLCMEKQACDAQARIKNVDTENRMLVRRVIRKAAGEDMILSLSEKSDLITKLGIYEIIDENELIALIPESGAIDVYATTNSRCFEDRSSVTADSDDTRYIDRLSPKRLREYLGEVEVEKNE